MSNMPAAILSTIRRDGWQWRNERETFHGNAQMMIKNWVLKGLNNASPSLAAAKMVSDAIAESIAVKCYLFTRLHQS